MGDVLDFMKKYREENFDFSNENVPPVVQKRLEKCFKNMYYTDAMCKCDYCSYRKSKAKEIFAKYIKELVVDAQKDELDNLSTLDLKLMFYQAIGEVIKYEVYLENGGSNSEEN